jgi:hypothetical protein
VTLSAVRVHVVLHIILSIKPRPIPPPGVILAAPGRLPQPYGPLRASLSLAHLRRPSTSLRRAMYRCDAISAYMSC